MKHIKRISLLILTLYCFCHSAQAKDKPWYEFSSDGRVCHIYNRDLPTPWLNRLTNGYLTAWVTQKGGIEVYLSDPAINTLVNPQNVSGNFYLRKEGSSDITWINNPENEDAWECQVGLGYTKLVCVKDDVKSEVTYFIPLDDNVVVMRVHLTNLSASPQKLNIYGQVEWNLGDRNKYIIYRGDGRAGSQFNLYKKTWFSENTIWATQTNWLSTADCRPWPYTGYFSASIPIESFETIRRKFLGSMQSFAEPREILEDKLSNTTFWSEDDFPWGVLQTKRSLDPKGETDLVYILGMDRSMDVARQTIHKYSDPETVQKEFDRLNTYYDNLIAENITSKTPDSTNDLINNVWTKYHWNQIRKISQNDPDVVGTGVWAYGLEGGDVSVMPEQIMLPFNKSFLEKEILYMLSNQTNDLSKTNLVVHLPAMKYEDLQMKGKPAFPANHFNVPHHHVVWGFMTSLLEYLKEYGDSDFLNRDINFYDGTSGTIWDHIDKAFIISLSGLSVNGLPRIPANVGDWMDEFTKISEYGQAESVMFGMELCYYLNEFAKIAGLAGKTDLQKKWKEEYEFIKNAINETAWDGNWYIRAFSDRDGNRIPVGTKDDDEGKIYLNAQSWSVMSGVATPERAEKALNSVQSMMISDFGPMIFYPSYSKYKDYIGTQSIYAPGFRNGNIYMRPTGWAVISACMAGKSKLAWEMYNKASLAHQIKDIEVYQCEPYVYPENYVGPDHRLAGKGQFQWCLGEATAWMWMAYNYYLLGIRPEFNGLIIDPHMPDNWDSYSVERPFRGDHYSIIVKRNVRLGPGQIKIQLDGKTIKGNLITPAMDGAVHKIYVETGPSL